MAKQKDIWVMAEWARSMGRQVMRPLCCEKKLQLSWLKQNIAEIVDEAGKEARDSHEKLLWCTCLISALGSMGVSVMQQSASHLYFNLLHKLYNIKGQVFSYKEQGNDQWDWDSLLAHPQQGKNLGSSLETFSKPYFSKGEEETKRT